VKHETIRACSIWRALEVVGDVPVLLIMEQAFLGKHRFAEFVQETGIARSVISNRLNRLVEADIFSKLQENRSGYGLTKKGHDLFPVALMILRWQHRWELGERGFAVELIHRVCAQKMVPVAACQHCGTEIDAREVSWAAGPGISNITPVYSRRRSQTPSAIAKRGNRTMVDSVIGLFGDRWATLVVRACFTGISRFDEIQRDTAMATNILSDRLDSLQNQGIITAKPYSSHPGRFEYRLTEKGRDIYPVLLALLHWGDVWYADAKGPPLVLTHQNCGHSLHLATKCSACGDQIDHRGVAFSI
jgi:DNA-binding HxlR family transcriptional regulator